MSIQQPTTGYEMSNDLELNNNAYMMQTSSP